MMIHEAPEQYERHLMEADIKKTFTSFLEEGQKEIIREEGKFLEPYLNVIKEMLNKCSHIMVISCQDFINFNQDMAQIVF